VWYYQYHTISLCDIISIMRSHCVILSVSYDLTVILSVSCDLTDIIIIIRSHYVILSVSYDLTVWYYQYHTISLCDIISINKLRWMLKIIGQCDVKHIMMLPIKTIINKPISELQISCVFAFFTLWKRVKAHVLSDQSVHLCKLSKFGAYLYAVDDNTSCT
jgi:hypothetical protein